MGVPLAARLYLLPQSSETKDFCPTSSTQRSQPPESMCLLYVSLLQDIALHFLLLLWFERHSPSILVILQHNALPDLNFS